MASSLTKSKSKEDYRYDLESVLLVIKVRSLIICSEYTVREVYITVNVSQFNGIEERNSTFKRIYPTSFWRCVSLVSLSILLFTFLLIV